MSPHYRKFLVDPKGMPRIPGESISLRVEGLNAGFSVHSYSPARGTPLQFIANLCEHKCFAVESIQLVHFFHPSASTFATASGVRSPISARPRSASSAACSAPPVISALVGFAAPPSRNIAHSRSAGNTLHIFTASRFGSLPVFRISTRSHVRKCSKSASPARWRSPPEQCVMTGKGSARGVLPGKGMGIARRARPIARPVSTTWKECPITLLNGTL